MRQPYNLALSLGFTTLIHSFIQWTRRETMLLTTTSHFCQFTIRDWCSKRIAKNNKGKKYWNYWIVHHRVHWSGFERESKEIFMQFQILKQKTQTWHRLATFSLVLCSWPLIKIQVTKQLLSKDQTAFTLLDQQIYPTPLQNLDHWLMKTKTTCPYPSYRMASISYIFHKNNSNAKTFCKRDKS